METPPGGLAQSIAASSFDVGTPGAVTPSHGVPPSDQRPAEGDAVDDDEESDAGGHLAALQDDVEAAEQENEALRELLRTGRRRIGEFHAQLFMDNNRLNNSYAVLAAEAEELQKTEDLLQRRLQFYFDDSRRLTTDNNAIVAEAARRDEELREAEKLVSQRQSVFMGTTRNVRRASRALADAEKALFNTREQVFAKRAKAVDQHRHMWLLEDRIAATKVERDYLTQLNDGVASSDLPACPASLSSEIGDDGTRVVASGQAHTTGMSTCDRADCREVRAAIESLRTAVEAARRRPPVPRSTSLRRQSVAGAGLPARGANGSRAGRSRQSRNRIQRRSPSPGGM
jgi:hypothetical protein